MEPRAAIATWEDGRLVHYACTQMPHLLQDELATAYGLEPAQVRVIAPDVGGGFGSKSGINSEEHLIGWIAKQLGRPARWVESRTESMVTLPHGRGQINYVELGATNDGKVLAFRHRLVQDAGAYPLVGAFLPVMTRLLASGTYAIPKIEFNAQSVVTNTSPTGTYRGAGRPEATYAIERGMDLLAVELGLDPADLRRRNFIQPEQFPYQTASGATYDSGDYERALELALDAANYDALRDEQRRRRDAGDPIELGIGISAYVEVTNPIPGGEYGAIEVTPDGKANVFAGTFSHGQGHHTAFAMIVAERLGIDLDDIDFIQGDTDQIRFGQGTVGSRSLQTAGVAVNDASTQVLDRARELAARLLEANPDDLVLDLAEGRWHVVGTPTAAKTWADLAAAAVEDGQPLRARRRFHAHRTDFPVWCAHRRCRGRHRNRRRDPFADCHGRRLWPDSESFDHRGPTPRGNRTRRRTSATRRGLLRRGRQPAYHQFRRLRNDLGDGAALVRVGSDGDADAKQRARREGNW